MPNFQTEKKVNHSAQQMFDLVADIEKYPEFLPLCKALTIRSRQEKNNDSLLTADMTVGYKLVKETFTTQVHLRPDDKQIDVQYIDGPFKHLENRWRFLPIEGLSEKQEKELNSNINTDSQIKDNESFSDSSAEVSDICNVDFYIDYAFKNPLLATLMGSMFDTAFHKFTQAFETRADIIYNKS